MPWKECHVMDERRVKDFPAIVELVDDPLVAARELHCTADDSLEHVAEVECRTDGCYSMT